MITNETEFRKAHDKAWVEYVQPLIDNGDVVFECSDTLNEHLLKCANGEYSDEEILELMDVGKM